MRQRAESLGEQGRNKDDLQFEVLIKEHRFLLSRVASTYEAIESLQQELLQEICIAIWQGLKRFKGDASIKTYILRIAHNRAITHVSKESKQFSSASDDDVSNSATYSLHTSQVHSEAKAMQDQKVERLLECIRAMKLPARQVISLSLEGLSYAEIAEVTGLSATNVGAMVSRTKKELKRQLENEQ